MLVKVCNWYLRDSKMQKLQLFSKNDFFSPQGSCVWCQQVAIDAISSSVDNIMKAP